MAAAPAEKKKAKWGYTDSKGKKVTALQDMTDGGGYGGNGGAYATMSNEQYRSLKGPERGTTKPAGFYRQGPEGKGEHLTGLRGVMANPVYGGLLGLLTGGPMGAAMGFGGQSIRNDVRAKGGLLNALGAGQQQASQQQVGLGSSPRPQIRPANLALPQVASPNQSYLGPFDPRVSTGQVDFGTNAFGPLSSIGLNSQALNGFNPTGDLTPAGAITAPALPPRPETQFAEMQLAANDSRMGMATEPPFQPYTPPYGTDVMPRTINPDGVPYSSVNGASGALGVKPSALASYRNSAKMPPKGMSELAYTNWLRNNGGMLNVDKMTPDGIRSFYQNYLNIR